MVFYLLHSSLHDATFPIMQHYINTLLTFAAIAALVESFKCSNRFLCCAYAAIFIAAIYFFSCSIAEK